MKVILTDANFPRTADQRVYHLGLRAGEIANRVITVGAQSRAQSIGSIFDEAPKPFNLVSERGFNTITGRYKGVPVSVVSIGMGSPNMDFFVRETRECLVGDMIVIRLGSCGAIVDAPVGSVVVPKASVAVSRNLDYDFHLGTSTEPPYRISRPVLADPTLHSHIHQCLERARPENSDTTIIGNRSNASADSFYSSQGRNTSFADHNMNLLHDIRQTVPEVATLEMETFHLFHLANCWGRQPSKTEGQTSPLAAEVTGQNVPDSRSSQITLASRDVRALLNYSVIRAGAAHMVFASRTTQDFISPVKVAELEAWTGRGVLEALVTFEISPGQLHPEEGSVWEVK